MEDVTSSRERAADAVALPEPGHGHGSEHPSLRKRARRRSALVGIGLATLCYGIAALGASSMRGRGRPGGRWYRGLRKPRAHPPDRVFGPVWTALYGTMAYSAWRTWKAPPSRARTRALALWGTQLALNGAWSPLFFGARRPATALADLVALDAAAGAYAASASKVDRGAALAVAPYLGWLGFATYLNGGIVAKNPRARR